MFVRTDSPRFARLRLGEAGLAARSDRLQDLIYAVANGDAPALERLYQLTSRQIYGTVLRILREKDAAARATEESYLRIWCGATLYDPSTHTPINWLLTIARATAFDAARGKASLPIDAYREPMAADENAAEENAVTAGPEMKRLLAAFGELSGDLRKMSLLAYYDGWSREALSLEFDAPPSTIRTWLLRSLEHIRARVPA